MPSDTGSFRPSVTDGDLLSAAVGRSDELGDQEPPRVVTNHGNAGVPLTFCCGDQAGNTDQADGASDVVGERREAELAPDASQPPHQEGALVHPLLDRAERVLDAGSALIQDLGTGCEPRGHAVKHGLVLQA